MSTLPASTCPEETALARLMQGEMLEQDAERVSEHLRTCTTCAETVRNLRTTDTLAVALRDRPEDVADAADSAKVHELIERLRSLRPAMADAGSARTLPEASGSTSELLDSPSPRTNQEGGQPTEALCSFLAPAERPDEIGRLGPYRVLSLIGAGGMGIVFEAEDPALGRRVALKVMNPALAENEADRRRFLREARATAAIEHDHIVAIYQVGEDRDVPYLAMQLLRGESLDARLERERRLAVPDALRIGREIAAGLAAAHARGLIHRDIKPANVFLEARVQGSGFGVQESTSSSALNPEPRTLNPPFRVKILDFGLARVQKDELGISQTSSIAGTPAYMAPEQAQGLKVDCRADLFSLGCLLYRALTGDLPFQGVNAFAVLVEVTGRDPKPPRLLNPDIPPALESLVMKLLAKDPAKRYQSAAEVMEELGEIETKSGARNDRGNSLPQASTRRMVSAVAAIAVFVLAIIAYFAGTQIFRVKTPHGTIVLEMDSREAEGAEVFVDEQHRITVQLHGESEPFAINVDPGTHKLRVVKAGFEVFTRDFSLKAGKREQIRVRLEPAGEAGTADVASGRSPNVSPATKSGAKPAPAIARAGATAPGVWPGLVSRSPAVTGLRRWQIETAMPRGDVFALAWDRDGRRIACGSPIGHVRIIDANSSELLHLMPAHQGIVWAIDWSRDGDHIVTAGDDGAVRLYDSGGILERQLGQHSSLVRTVAFSPDGAWVASAGWDSTVRLWRTSGEVGPVLQGHTVQVDAVAWHPAGKRLASASWDGTVRMWNLDGSAGPVLKGHAGGVLGLAWSPDGELLASGGNDGAIRLWTSDGAERSVLYGHSGAVSAIAWSTGDVLASGGNDGTVRFWRRDGTPLKSQGFEVGRINVLAWTRDGVRLAAACDDQTVRFLDKAGEPAGAVSHETAAIRSIDWNNAGKLATIGDDRTVRVLNEDGTQRSLLKGHTKKAYSVSWNRTGDRLVSAGRDGVRVWNLADGTAAVRNGFTPASWNPAGDEIAWTIGWDVYLEAAPDAPPRVLGGHKSHVIQLAWNSDGSQLASADVNAEIRLWGRDGLAGPVMQSVPTVMALAWNPKRPVLAAGCGGAGHIQLWRADGSLSKAWNGHPNGILALAWSPDGERLLSSGYDRTVRIWTAAGTPAGTLPGAMANANDAAWDATGQRIATAHTDGTIRLWDSESLEPQWITQFFNDGNWVRFDRTGDIATGDQSAADRLLVYLVEDDLGAVHLLKPAEFRERWLPPSSDRQP